MAEQYTNEVAHNIEQMFLQAFGADPVLVRSPGRVNLIGEHTDYNNGFVLPAAINKAIYVAVGKSGNDMCEYIAADIDETYIGSIHELKQEAGHWSLYINGVIDQLQKAGHSIEGFNCVIGGDIPTGAGVSSSAAVECAMIFALNELFQLGLDKITMVKLAQKAENEFVGVKCGIMDQFASMFGKKNQVIKLDCRSLEYEYKPFNLEGIRIVLFDTQVKHSLASSAYNTRRQECEKGVAIVKEFHPAVESLRDITPQMLEEHVRPVDETVYRRCRFVVDEIQRLQDACADLEKNNIKAFGEKMYSTHTGLSEWYDVSCAELDFLISLVKDEPAVLGARMMGGGFGGCTINLVKEEAIEALAQKVKEAYDQQFNLDMKFYVASIEDGTALFTNNSDATT